MLDILVQSRRNRRAAVRFFRKLLKKQGCLPRRLVTDKLRSYPAAHRTVMPSVVHRTEQYANNRAEVSHQPTRQRERQMRRFKSAAPSAAVRGRPRRGAQSLPGRPTPAAINSPPLASPPSVRRVGGGDVCLLTDGEDICTIGEQDCPRSINLTIPHGDLETKPDAAASLKAADVRRDRGVTLRRDRPTRR